MGRTIEVGSIMGSFEALITIALLCQVPGSKIGSPLKSQDAQLKCQKEYIRCIESGIKDTKKEWVGPLKECVLNKKLDS